MPEAPQQFSPSSTKKKKGKNKKNKEEKKQESHNWNHDKSRHERGYDSKWVKLRNSYIEENYLCETCLEMRKITPSSEVDHIKRFKGKNDPLRLDRDNLQALCNACHKKKSTNDKKVK